MMVISKTSPKVRNCNPYLGYFIFNIVTLVKNKNNGKKEHSQ